MCRPISFLALLLLTITPCRADAPAPADAPAAETAAAPATAPVSQGLSDSDFLAICGDSITEQKLYSVNVQTYLLACRPRNELRAMQFGWSGEAVGGFLGRMSNVLRFPVTAVTTCYGMNDGGYAPLTPERAAAYREGTRKIVETFKNSGVRLIVVGSPGAVDSRFYRPEPNADEDKVYNQTLAELRDLAKQVAEEQGVAFADVHAAMMDVMPKAKAKYGEDYPVGGADGVHPAPNGHLIMAYAFLKALGCDGQIGTITVDLAGNKAEATDGHTILSADGGAVEIESTRYPFCFFGEPADPKSTSGIIEFFPFNDDLNRYLLIVNNPGAERLKVTWGSESKEYTAEQLSKGINLAAEFLVNPFSEPFKKVEEAVRAQQNFETPLVKRMLHDLPAYLQMLPEQKETLDTLVQAGIDKAKQLNDASVAAVEPVKHVIRLEKVQ